MRILVGLAAFYFVFSHSFDLVRWFGPHGNLSDDPLSKLSGADASQMSFQLSYLNLFDAPVFLWIVHVLGMLVVMALMLGLATRVTSVLSVVVVLSYIHRAPMITGPFEPVLTAMLIYPELQLAGSFGTLQPLLLPVRIVSEL